MLLIYLIHVLVIFFLSFHALGWVISFFRNRKLKTLDFKKRKYASIITAYKQVEIAEPLIESLVRQSYGNQTIYLVADRCDPYKVEQLASRYPIKVIQPASPFDSKVKSIKAVVELLDKSFNAVVIFDPDNLAHPDFLYRINESMSMGFEAVQGQRTAKNLETQIACLDALGEFYYNVNTRLIPFQIGSSATIAGSGMAIDLNLYKEYLQLEDVTERPGKVVIAEDKILQTFIVKQNKTIAYAPQAVVYDEKIGTAMQLQRQRTRWINTWFKHAGEGTQLLTQFSFNRIWFALLTFYPPMFLQWLTAFAIIVVDLVFFPLLSLGIIAGLTLFAAHFIHSLSIGNAPKKVIHSIVGLPLFVTKQIASLLQMKRSNKDFMVTEHTQNIRIQDLLISKP
jgi:cellulose synthase/poly-beta-1,6-N-acetylglucosamine synthase-like glycosyltransferase